MNRQLTTAAPQASLSGGLFERWLETHTGTEDDFYTFMCTPSPERSLFLGGLSPEIEVYEGTATATYQ